MIKNYLKIGLRNLSKHRVYSIINISGLAVGMASFILIGLYVFNELSYDKYHQNADRIFRVGVTLELNGIVYDEASIQFPAAEVLESDYPEIEKTIRIYKNVESPLIEYGDKKISEEKFFFADNSFFDLFDFEFINGNPKTALKEVNSVVITKETAEKYFGQENPIGKTLSYENESDLIVTGVIKKVNANSHFTFDFIASLDFQMSMWNSQNGIEGRHNKWFWTGAWTYVLLNEKESADGLSRKLPEFINKYFPDRYKTGATLNLQPLTDIHLHSDLDNEIEQNSSILYIYVFSTVAIFIIFIACINFINLSIAQANNKAKEVGIRKVLGAYRSQLIFQFLSETIISSVLATMSALFLIELAEPLFYDILNKPLSISLYENYFGIIIIVSVTLLVGVLSGIFPAIFLSNFNPAKIFKKMLSINFSYEFLRKSLVVLQFSTSIFLIIAIAVIYQQLHFVNSKELGFDREKVIVVKARSDVNKKFDAFRNELLKNKNILNVSGTSDIPGRGANASRFVPEGTSHENPVMLPITLVGYDFAESMDIEITKGKNFSRNFPSDVSEGFLLNNKAVQKLGWENGPIGKKMELYAPGTNEIGKSGYVIGVVDDYHYESLHSEVKPLVLSFSNNYTYYLVRFDKGNFDDQLKYVESTWNTFSPEWPFESFFLDKDLEQSYENDQQLGTIVNYFALIAIIISCMGLFGLATYSAEKRVKEIGIRKVLGASVDNIVRLLSLDFIKLVLIANVISWPIAYYIMNSWLEDFAYRIDLNIWIFILAGLVTLLLALLTITFKTLRAALANPVDSLKYE